MTVAAVIFTLGCLFFGTGVFYLGTMMKKMIRLGGGYSSRKNMVYRKGLRRLAAELREAANVGDSTALAALSTIAEVEDEVTKVDTDYEERIKKETGTK